MNTEQLREEIIRLGPWHHDVEIAPGLRTGEANASGVYPAELGTPTVNYPETYISQLVRELYPDGLAGRSFLDCACNAGGHLFAAARHGAGRSFGFDVRDHWIAQARFLAQHLPSENIAFATLDLMSLPERRLESFDITLFSGILYHLPDPLAGLRIAADHTHELIIVNTATCPNGADSLVLNRESTTEVMSGVHGLAWLPSGERVLREILEWCGFPHARLRWQKSKTVGNRGRMEILAAREASTFAYYDVQRSQSEQKIRSGWMRRGLRRALTRTR